MFDRYVREVINGPRMDRYKALVVYDAAGGKGKTQYFLAVGPSLYFRGMINFRAWNDRPNVRPEPLFLLLDDVDLIGPCSNVSSDNRRKAILNGTGSFDLCTTGGAYAYTLVHGLPTVVLTNDITFFTYIRSERSLIVERF